jgi:hypothetical protein
MNASVNSQVAIIFLTRFFTIRYSKLTLFKDEYYNCKSDEKSEVISEVLPIIFLQEYRVDSFFLFFSVTEK